MPYGQVPYFNVQFDYQNRLETSGYGSVETDSFYIIPSKGASPFQSVGDTSFLLSINKFTAQLDYKKIVYFKGQSVTSVLKKNNTLVVQGSSYSGVKEYNYVDNNRYLALLDQNTLDTLLIREYGLLNKVDVFSRPILTSEGGIFSAGYSYGLQPQYDRSSLLVFKCDSNLNQQFLKLYSMSQINNHFGAGAVETPDKGFIVVGNRQVGNPVKYVYALIVKVDSLGNQVFWKEIPHQGDTIDLYLRGVNPINNGGYIAVGSLVFNPQVGPGWERSWVVGFDGQGNVLWSKAYAENERSGWQSMTPSHDGNFYACGYERDWVDPQSKQYGTISKLSPTGDLIWHRKYSVEPLAKLYDNFFNVLATSDGGILCNGTTYGPDGSLQNAWVMKLDAWGCASPGCQTGVGVQELPVGKATPFILWPNPTTGELNIEAKENFTLGAIRIFSSDGREVFNQSLSDNSTRFSASLSNRPEGSYVCSVLVNGVWYVRQFVLVK